MKAPDVIYCGADWFYRDSVIRGEVPIVCDTNKNEGDVEYIRLDKVKELIESERCEGSGFGELAINETINFLLDQLEGLE